MRHFSSTQNISIIGQKIFKMLKIEQNEIERKIKFSVIDSIIKKRLHKNRKPPMLTCKPCKRNFTNIKRRNLWLSNIFSFLEATLRQ